MHDLRPAPLPEADRRWLERACELAERGWGGVHRNPMVGCVLVRDGKAVAEGWHARYGGPHAEVEALSKAGGSARGATAYVSLEPCDHTGKTPPCSEALIAAGVSRVVYGAADPGPRSGGGHTRLANAGVDVSGPHLDGEQARRANPVFFSSLADRPWVALKLAIGSDGTIAARAGARTAITGGEANEDVHRLRAGFEAILVGSATAAVDDPRLTVRGSVQPFSPPARVVIDSRAVTRPDSALFEDEVPVIVVVGPDAPAERIGGLKRAGATVRVVERSGQGIDLGAALRALRAEDIRSVLVEGGARLATSLLRARLVDRFYLYRSGQPLGPDALPAFTDPDTTAAWIAAAAEGRPPEGWECLDRQAFGADVRSVWEPV